MNSAPKTQFLFLHVQKTAGTTLHEILKTLFDPDKVCPAVQLLDLRDCPDYQSRYALYSGHFNYHQFAAIRDNLNILTILREPVDRAISVYAHVMRDTKTAKRSELMAKAQKDGMSLEQFVAHDDMKEMITNRAVSSIGDGNLNRALDRLEQFDFVGITENFDQSLRLLCDTFSWSLPEAYKNQRVATNRPASEEIPQHVLEMISELNNEDLVLYQRGYELFRQRCEQRGISPA